MADGRPLKSKEKSKGKPTLGIRDGVEHHLNAVGLDDIFPVDRTTEKCISCGSSIISYVDHIAYCVYIFNITRTFTGCHTGHRTRQASTHCTATLTLSEQSSLRAASASLPYVTDLGTKLRNALLYTNA